MGAYEFDLFTIGAGSGGVRASRMAATLGAKVAVCDRAALGGTCVNLGCVPKKLMVYASHAHEELMQARGFGWSTPDATFDWGAFMARKNAEIARLNKVYEGLLSAAGVEIVRGDARVVGPHEVVVDGRRFTAERILVATGGRPMRTGEPGAELGLVSDDVFHLEKQPRRILVAGGGYIAVEFAGIFAGLGSEVTQIYRGPHILRGFDDDARAFLTSEMRKKGVRFVLNAIIARIERTASGLECQLSDDDTLEVDAVLYAIGRVPNTRGLGLEEVGVVLGKRGEVVVDDAARTSVDSIYAIGDVTDRINLTPVAIAEATALVRRLFGGEAARVDYDNVPTAVFSQPPLASVGLGEAAAREGHARVEVYTSEFRPLKHTLSGSDERTFIKVIVETDSDRVVGAHMVGMDAPEIIQGIAVAMKCGVTKAQLDGTVGIHPTSAEEFVTMRRSPLKV